MAKNKKKYSEEPLEEPYEETFSQPYEEPLDDEEYSSHSSELEEKEKPTMDRIFDFNRSILSFEMQMRGYDYNSLTCTWNKVTDEKGPDEFIKQTMLLLTSMITSTNFWSYKDSKEAERIKLDTITSFVNLCIDEEFCLEEEHESLVTSFDNVMDLFMGLVERGHGAQTLKEIYAGVATTLEQSKIDKKSDFLQGLADKLSFGGNN